MICYINKRVTLQCSKLVKKEEMSFNVKDLKRKRRSGSAPGEVGRERGYTVGVVDKLKNHEEFRGRGDEELRMVAKQLTDVKELHAEFSHLNDVLFEQYAEEIADEADVPLDHPKEQQAAQVRIISRLRPPSVKLYLFELKRPVSRFFSKFSKLFTLKYGALHAAIQIEDVVLQWSTSSLVVPERYHPADPVFLTDVKHRTAAAKIATDLQAQVIQTSGQIDYSTQMDLQYDLAVNVEQMLEKVKEVIVKYNRYRYYNVFACNCQHFVEDVMKAIGVKNVPQNLTGKLKDYFKQLIAKKSKCIPTEFPTHQSLDDYVQTQDVTKLEQHDKEYLLCLYFQFHLEAMKASGYAAEECLVDGCLMEMVETSLQASKMLLLESCSA